jgi:acetyl esterase/lipase
MDSSLWAGEPTRHSYGTDPSQYGELFLPGSGRRPGTVVLIHGGFWRARYGAELGVPLAADLAGRGWAAWNLEYRRVGNGGGWPTTFDDVAAGIDRLSELKQSGADLDLDRVVAIGHSAGGQLATWAASRAELPPGAPGAAPKVRLTGVIAQAGVLDLARAAREQVGGRAVPGMMGATPEEVPERYQLASPQQRLPLSVPVRCVHGRADQKVPFEQSADYVKSAVAAGSDASLIEVPGDHFALIDPATPAWRAVLDLLAQLIGG